MTAAAMLRGSWANISRFALVALAGSGKAPQDMRAEAHRRLLAAADSMRARVEKQDGYRCATEADGYYWGSNSNLAEKALLLLDAYRLGGKDYAWAREAARDQWHWLMGRNPNGYSMVTRVGKGPERFYHTEWGGKRTPPPGYLINGPNALNAGFLAPHAPAKALLWDNPQPLRSGAPAHAMWHNTQSDLWDGKFIKENTWTTGWWTVVECDILYNANLVALAAAMQ
jgi:endoglucanase